MSVTPINDFGFKANTSTLRHEEHIRYDAELIDVARDRLRIFADFQAAGMITPIPNVGVTISKWERMSDLTPASIDMDGSSAGDMDRLVFDEVGVPIPVFHKEFKLSWRQLAASRTRGEPLDSAQMRVSTRIVTDEIESHIFHGIPNLTVSGLKVPGLLTFEDRNTYSLSAPWKDSSADKRDIVQDVANMIQALYDDRMYGPYVLYVPREYWSALQIDYSTEKGDKTFLERIQAFSDISAVRVADYLPAGNVVLLQMNKDTADIAVAQDLTHREYDNNDMEYLFKVYGVLVIRCKSDQNGRCGLLHATAPTT